MINKLTTIIEETITQLSWPNPNIQVTKSNRPDLCDYQYNGVFFLAKKLNKTPEEIGETLKNTILKNNEDEHLFKTIKFVKPGFINITLSSIAINNYLNSMLTTPKFNITMPKKQTIIIDYGGANIAKPLHVGHLRPAIIGESIKRLLKYMNQKVISDVHLGDYGLQIGEVIYGLIKEEIKPENITLKKLEEIYPKISNLCKENENIKEVCAEITKQLQENNQLYQTYFKEILKISKQDIKRIYDYLDVTFDLWYGESDAYKYIDDLTNLINNEKLFQISENAKIIPVQTNTDKLEIPPLIYQKSNGAYLYSTTDLATIYQRKKDYNPDKIIYVADIRQNLHFTQVFRVAKKIPYLKNIDYQFLGFGTINGPDGKPYKTRAGNTPKLDQLFLETQELFISQKETNQTLETKDLQKIVGAIIKFADLQNTREKDYIFDLKKFSDVTGKTGPYILYTYLRVNKIIKNNPKTIDTLSQNIYNEHDRKLRIKLLELEQTINQAYQMISPSIIANFLYELCVSVNTFYEHNHINNLEDKEQRSNWIILLELTTKIIKDLLNILAIEIPTKM